MNYENVKRHFESSPPPKEVKWTEWAYISNTQLFLKNCYTGIRNFNAPIDRCPAWWHLMEFHILMKKTGSQPAPVKVNGSEENALEEIPAEHTAPRPI
ncbi:MAG: hypothetical protein REI96_12115 [Flavobacterium nitrogenifigens]|uniref:DUF6965 family protein n=1 Tax=Flavobacterium nitrogenifigens TaxID=1617283 RepID=UPI0028069AF2|nr:hypothetical protein [Flavobacterium nitrogenifigens]MDQ8013188.1 hypothetical protein [Flavobacterium nitrogenifigens]